MPRRIQPTSLRQASLMSIARNFNYWCAGQSPSQTDFISPFQDLQEDMIEEIIKQLEKDVVFVRNIRFLFHPYLHRLKLLCIDDPLSVQVLSTICQKLTHLSLRCARVRPAVLCELVSSLTELVSLDLQGTKADRSVIKAIADNCPKLHDLNVKQCPDLEDSDFLLLCNQPEPPRIRLQLTNLRLSRGIYQLSVNTVISLLNSHLKLKSLGDCELIDQVFCQMYGTEYQHKKEVPQTWIQNLSEVTLYGRIEEIVDLELTTRCCPHLTTLSLRLANGDIQSLRAASNLKSLKSLSIFGVLGGRFSKTFQTDVVPILEKIGGNLTSLSLEKMNDVCVLLIGEFCPNLQSLFLRVGFRKTYTYNRKTEHHFRHLQVLEMSCYKYSSDYATIPTEVLPGILVNSPEINNITFDCVQNLTDSIISKADKRHGFHFLTYAWFRSCPLITKETGMILLSPDNPLEELHFWDCKYITSQDENIFRQYAEHSQVTIIVNKVKEVDESSSEEFSSMYGSDSDSDCIIVD